MAATKNISMIYTLIVDALDQAGVNVVGYGPPSEVLTKLTAQSDNLFAVIEFPQSEYSTDELLGIKFDVTTVWTIWIYSGAETQAINNTSAFNGMVLQHSNCQSKYLYALDRLMCVQEHCQNQDVVFNHLGSTGATFFEEHSSRRLLGGRFTLSTRYFQRCTNLPDNCDCPE